MTPERYQQVRKLYQAADSCAPPDRDAFLRAECGGDADLLHEVGSLLAAEAEAAAGDYLNQPAIALEAEARSHEPRASLAARQLSHYEIGDLLGAGGMGEVWRARDTRLDRSVALKVLPWQYTQDASRLQRFLREAKTASALNHQNIVTIYDIGQVTTEEGELHFIATELIEGVTLRQHLETAGRIPWRTAIEIAAQIAAALEAAHRAGIIHRDIKPENVMLRADGVVKVLDFGLAKLTARAAASPSGFDTGPAAHATQPQTQPGMILGTMRYMSPEQARGKEVTAQTDLFSLGALLYELLTGQPLFAGETTADVIGDILHKEPPPLHEVAADAPLELEQVLHQSLAKDVTKRYASARALLDDFQILKGSGERRTSASFAHRKNDSIALRWRAPRFALWQMALGVTAALLLAGVIWWMRPSNLSSQPLNSIEIHNWSSASGELYSEGKLSPDGKWIAFTSTERGQVNVWLKSVTGGDAQPSTDDEFLNHQPLWSPNGDELAYLSNRGGSLGLWRKPMLGGTPTLLMAFPVESRDARLRYWSQNGSLFYESRQNLFALQVASGTTKNLTNFRSENSGKSYFSPSPDGQWVAYVELLPDGRSEIWTVPATGGAPRQIAKMPEGARNTVWHPDNQRVFFSAKVNGVQQVFVGDTRSRSPQQLTYRETDSLVVDVSADGSRILYGASNEFSDIWGVNKNNAQEFVLASDANAELWPNVSPDSRTIAYQSVPNLNQGAGIDSGNILTKALGATGSAFTLVKNGGEAQWSPTGKHLAFVRYTNHVGNLWLVPAQGGTAQQLTQNGCEPSAYSVMPYNRIQARNFDWSPDGSQIIYLSTKDEQINLWAINADGTGSMPLPVTGDDPNWWLECPFWSPNGKLIALLGSAREEGKRSYGIWVTDPIAKTAKLIYQTESAFRLIGWSPDAVSLFFAIYSGKPDITQPDTVTIASIALASGEMRRLVELPLAYFPNIHLSPDGLSLAYVARTEEKDNLWVRLLRGGNAKQLTANSDHRVYFSGLVWSPNSQAVYFGKQSRYSSLSMLTNYY